MLDASIHLAGLRPRRSASTARTIAASLILVFASVGTGQTLAGEPPPDWQVTGLKAALRDPHPDVLSGAVRYLNAAALFGALDETSRAAVAPRLVGLLDRRHRALQLDEWEGALVAIGALGKDQVSRLGELLSDSDWFMRSAAEMALFKLGEYAKEQAPRLTELLSDPDPGVRRAAGETVSKMRLSDEPAFARDEFTNELEVMARYKMVVPHHDIGTDQEASPRWRFRHDRFMDFFLVQAFLGLADKLKRPRKHLGDTRFRGTYLQLADLMSIEQAEELERLLIDRAADTRDHSLSDDFVQRLRPRRAASPMAHSILRLGALNR